MKHRPYLLVNKVTKVYNLLEIQKKYKKLKLHAHNHNSNSVELAHPYKYNSPGRTTYVTGDKIHAIFITTFRIISPIIKIIKNI